MSGESSWVCQAGLFLCDIGDVFQDSSGPPGARTVQNFPCSIVLAPGANPTGQSLGLFPPPSPPGRAGQVGLAVEPVTNVPCRTRPKNPAHGKGQWELHPAQRLVFNVFPAAANHIQALNRAALYMNLSADFNRGY